MRRMKCACSMQRETEGETRGVGGGARGRGLTCNESPRRLPCLRHRLYLARGKVGGCNLNLATPPKALAGGARMTSTAMIGVRVLACERRRAGGDAPASPRAHGGARGADAQAPVFSAFPRLQELRHPNLAPYIDLYEIRGRAYLLSYHTRVTLASLLADGAAPEAPTAWDRDVELGGALGAAAGGEAVAGDGDGGRRLSAAAVSRVCLQVGRAVEFLHARGLVHGRITPHCILLAPGEPHSGPQTVLLSDYGAQHLTTGGGDASRVLPLEFCAPETIAALLLRRATPCAQPPAREATGAPDGLQGGADALEPPADLWAIGAVMLFALCSSCPRLPWGAPRGWSQGRDESHDSCAAGAICSGILAYAGLPSANRSFLLLRLATAL